MKIIPKKLQQILIIIVVIIAIGTVGFKLIGGESKSFLDALYMTAITITTVGYGDVIGLDDKPYGKLFTIIFVFIGAGAIAYLFTTLAAYIIEGELKKVLQEENHGETHSEDERPLYHMRHRDGGTLCHP